LTVPDPDVTTRCTVVDGAGVVLGPGGEVGGGIQAPVHDMPTRVALERALLERQVLAEDAAAFALS
jgi:hypothetical protein